MLQSTCKSGRANVRHYVVDRMNARSVSQDFCRAYLPKKNKDCGKEDSALVDSSPQRHCLRAQALQQLRSSRHCRLAQKSVRAARFAWILYKMRARNAGASAQSLSTNT